MHKAEAHDLGVSDHDVRCERRAVEERGDKVGIDAGGGGGGEARVELSSDAGEDQPEASALSARQLDKVVRSLPERGKDGGSGGGRASSRWAGPGLAGENLAQR